MKRGDKANARPLRIAFVKRHYTPFGGAERYLSLVMQQLVEKGHQVHLFTNRWEEHQRWTRPLEIHPVSVLPGPSYVKAVSFASQVHRRLRREDFDIVHSFDRTYSQDIYRAGGGCHREWVCQRRKTESPLERLISPRLRPSDRLLMWLERKAFTQTPLIIANSSRGKREIITHYKIEPERIRVIYNGVDLDTYHPRNRTYRTDVRNEHGIADDELVILFVGSGFRRKGVGPLIQALSVLAQREWRALPFRLLIVGKGKVRRYERLAARGGILSRVLFLGPRREVHRLHGGVDLFALPTCYDPFSNASLEAMASGLPVITSRMNGVSEILDEKKAGGIVENPLEPEQLAQTLSRFVDRATCEQAGAEARRIAEAHPLSRTVEALMALYEEYRAGLARPPQNAT